MVDSVIRSPLLQRQPGLHPHLDPRPHSVVTHFDEGTSFVIEDDLNTSLPAVGTGRSDPPAIG